MLAIVHRWGWDVSHIPCKGMLCRHFVHRQVAIYVTYYTKIVALERVQPVELTWFGLFMGKLI